MRRFAAAVMLSCLSPFASAATLHLIAPQRGATLRGGSFTSIEWTAAKLPANAEEWEAFLSLDGGKYYAFRITPHLDLERRQFTWIVPNVDTNDARILIRTGDEHRETLFELPIRFSIARDARASLPFGGATQLGRAEAARDGDANVIAWADRSGATQWSHSHEHNFAGVVARDDAAHHLLIAPKSMHARSVARFDAQRLPAIRIATAHDQNVPP